MVLQYQPLQYRLCDFFIILFKLTDGPNISKAIRSNPLDGSNVKYASSIDDATDDLYSSLNSQRTEMLTSGELNRPIQRRTPSQNSGRIMEVQSGNKSDAIDGKLPWTKQVKTADGTVIKYDNEGFPVLNDVLHK